MNHENLISTFVKKFQEHNDLEAKVKKRSLYHFSPLNSFLVRLQVTQANKDYNKTEDHLKALQSVGQIIGEVLKKTGENKCKVSLISV